MQCVSLYSICTLQSFNISKNLKPRLHMIAHDRWIVENTASDCQQLYGNVTFQQWGYRQRSLVIIWKHFSAIVRSSAVIWKHVSAIVRSSAVIWKHVSAIVSDRTPRALPCLYYGPVPCLCFFFHLLRFSAFRFYEGPTTGYFSPPHFDEF